MYKRLNEVTEDDLTSIRGIGLKTAKKILACLPVYQLEELAENDVPQHVISKLEAWLKNE